MFLCVKDLYLISHLDVLDDCVLLMFPGHGKLREPDLLTTVPLAVVPQDLNDQYKPRDLGGTRPLH